MKSRKAPIDSQTDRLTMTSSPHGRSAVASPDSSCNRQMKPGDPSAIALTGARPATKRGQLRAVERRDQPRDVELGQHPVTAR